MHSRFYQRHEREFITFNFIQNGADGRGNVDDDLLALGPGFHHGRQTHNQQHEVSDDDNVGLGAKNVPGHAYVLPYTPTLNDVQIRIVAKLSTCSDRLIQFI